MGARSPWDRTQRLLGGRGRSPWDRGPSRQPAFVGERRGSSAAQERPEWKSPFPYATALGCELNPSTTL